MNIKQFADLLGTAPNTIRNWTSVYGEFLSPGANPPRGHKRVITQHDMRVLNFIATMKNSGGEPATITTRLKDMQRNGWTALPNLPEEWGFLGETMPVAVAAGRASELAQVAVLQSELQHVRLDLEAAESRVTTLTDKLERLQSRYDSSEAEKTTLRLDLERARGEVRELQAQISGYTMAYGLGRDKPISLVVIVGVTLALGALLVIIAVVVGALVG